MHIFSELNQNAKCDIKQHFKYVISKYKARKIKVKL